MQIKVVAGRQSARRVWEGSRPGNGVAIRIVDAIDAAHFNKTNHHQVESADEHENGLNEIGPDHCIFPAADRDIVRVDPQQYDRLE